MPILCRFGIHDWKPKVTARPGVTVYRCARCNTYVRAIDGATRRKKRSYVIGAGIVSLSLWYVIVALGLTGHTKVIWGAQHVARDVDHIAGKIDRKVRKAEGAPAATATPEPAKAP